MHDLGRGLLRVAGTAVGWIVFLLLVLVFGGLFAPITLLLARRWPGVRERFAAFTAGAVGLYVRTLPFLRFSVEGAERRLHGGRIVVANHVSRLDSPLLLAIESRLAGPTRGYMLRVPGVGSVMRLLGFFDADVGEAASLDAVQRAAAHARAEGEGILFYPEGTRSRDGEIGSFRRGAFRAAVDHGLPLQPVVIEGLEAVLPPGSAIAQKDRSYVVRVRYLEPLRPPYGEGPRRDVVRALAERVHRNMQSELARMRTERRAEAAQRPGDSSGRTP